MKSNKELQTMITRNLNNAIDTFIRTTQSINIRFDDGSTPLHVAIHHYNLLLVNKFLHAPNVNPNIVNSLGETCINYIILNFSDDSQTMINIFKMLLKNGANSELRTANRRLPLECAIEQNKCTFVLELLQANANPLALTQDGEILLYHVILLKRLNIMEAFLNNLIDTEVENVNNQRALHIAIQMESLHCLNRLLTFGAHIDFAEYQLREFLLNNAVLKNNEQFRIFCVYHLIRRFPTNLPHIENYYLYGELAHYITEVKSMRSMEKVNHIPFTYFEILIYDYNRCASEWLINEWFQQHFHTINHQMILKDYPIFGKILLQKINEIKNRAFHFNQILDYLNSKKSYLLSFPDNVIYLIIALVNNNEILRLNHGRNVRNSIVKFRKACLN